MNNVKDTIESAIALIECKLLENLFLELGTTKSCCNFIKSQTDAIYHMLTAVLTLINLKNNTNYN